MRTHFYFSAFLVMAIGAAGESWSAASNQGEEGFRSLFDGKTLSGWDGNPDFWSVEDGVIVGKTTPENPTQGNTFLVWRSGEVDDFELRLSFKINGGNSGVQYRSKEVEKWVISGYQADIDSEGNYVGALYEEKARGMLAKRGQQVRVTEDGKIQELGTTGEAGELLSAIKMGDWNDFTIMAQGNRISQAINGKITCEVIDDQKEKRAFSGLLALQLHAGPPMEVQFKDVRIKRLPLVDKKKVVLVAGNASHGWGEHDFPAGIHVLRKCLEQVPGIVVTDYYEGWPKDPSAFDNANTIVFYMDGGAGHPIIQANRLAELDALAKKGVGLACIHYAVEVPKEKGGKELKDWIGGYYETHYSINPHWVADFTKIPSHPVTNGVAPFRILDEWYYCMRFRGDMEGVTTILHAVPPDESRTTEETAKHKGRSEVVAWATEREDGGRGFGFTGGHFHSNWKNEDFRKLILNAILWTAGAEVPIDGVQSRITEEDFTLKLRPRPSK